MRFSAAIAVGILAAGALQAQTAPDSALAAAMRRLEIGTPIRLRTIGQSIYMGRLVERTDTSIVILEENTLQRASVARVGAVWLRQNSAGRGAIAGGVTGVIVGGFFFGLFSQGLCDSTDCSNAYFDGMVVGAPFGALAGVILGGIIGAFVPHWRPYWP
jgi:hypothetical protein